MTIDALALAPFLIPFVWLLVSVVVALALYKTSNALITEAKIAGIESGKVTLGGSSAIAVVVFILLWNSTDASTLDKHMTAKWEFMELAIAIRNHNNAISVAIIELDECMILTSQMGACEEHIEAIRRESLAIEDRLSLTKGEASE